MSITGKWFEDAAGGPVKVTLDTLTGSLFCPQNQRQVLLANVTIRGVRPNECQIVITPGSLPSYFCDNITKTLKRTDMLVADKSFRWHELLWARKKWRLLSFSLRTEWLGFSLLFCRVHKTSMGQPSVVRAIWQTLQRQLHRRGVTSFLTPKFHQIRVWSVSAPSRKQNWTVIVVRKSLIIAGPRLSSNASGPAVMCRATLKAQLVGVDRQQSKTVAEP